MFVLKKLRNNNNESFDKESNHRQKNFKQHEEE